MCLLKKVRGFLVFCFGNFFFGEDRISEGGVKGEMFKRKGFVCLVV